MHRPFQYSSLIILRVTSTCQAFCYIASNTERIGSRNACVKARHIHALNVQPERPAILSRRAVDDAYLFQHPGEGRFHHHAGYAPKGAVVGLGAPLVKAYLPCAPVAGGLRDALIALVVEGIKKELPFQCGGAGFLDILVLRQGVHSDLGEVGEQEKQLEAVFAHALQGDRAAMGKRVLQLVLHKVLRLALDLILRDLLRDLRRGDIFAHHQLIQLHRVLRPRQLQQGVFHILHAEAL